jgi:hypothetical protein
MENEPIPVKKYILYKLDRTIAIVGIVVIAIYSIVTKTTDSPIAMAALGGLVAYVGGRSNGK